MRLEIRHARVIVALAEAGSISKAATTLALPQPSLTAQLRRIERSVGGRLFVRSHTGITPTALGERLIPMFADLASRADAVIAEASSLSCGLLRLGFAGWTPVTLRAALQSSLPSFEVQTATMDPDAEVEAVANGTLTAALVPSADVVDPAPVSDQVLSEVVLREPTWLALPMKARHVSGWTAAPAELAGLPWVRHTQGHWFRAVEDAFFARLDQEGAKVLHEVGSQHEAMTWVREAGAAALVLPSGPAHDVWLLPAAGAPSVKETLLWQRGATAQSTVVDLVHALRRHYCELAASRPGCWNWMVEHAEEFPELAEFLS